MAALKKTEDVNTTILDSAIKILNENKTRWARLSISLKIKMLEDLISKCLDISQRWVSEACAAKGFDMEDPLANEEWLSGPYGLISACQQYINTLKLIQKSSSKKIPLSKMKVRQNGQLIVKVFPGNAYDWFLLNGINAVVWMDKSINRENIQDNIGSFYRKQNPSGKTSLILGAGNIASITPLDVLHKLIAEGEVAIVKMNPVNDYLGPIFEDIFSDFIENGFLYYTYGGVKVGKYLVEHEGIETIHMTGSERTYDAIVFGTGEEGRERKKKNEPLLIKPISSELGGITPTIIIPGPWTDKDISFQAEHLLIQKLHNAGSNCTASQILVTPEDWDLTPKLMDEIKIKLQDTKLRKAYYPGSEERQKAAIKGKKNVETFEGDVPRTLISHLDYRDENEYNFKNEVFGMVWGETRIPGKTALDFLQKAVLFCNERLRGSLSANIIIHPKTIIDLGPEFENLLSELKYGSIGVNIWTGAGYLLTHTSWGAYPGHTIDDIQSGIGYVHNTGLFDKPEKSIVCGSFYPFPRGMKHGSFALLPKPPWFLSHRKGHKLSEKLTKFSAKPRIWNLPAIFFEAFTG